MNTTHAPETVTINCENLNATNNETLNAALVEAQQGATVTIAVTYKKVTNSKPRVAGVDYMPLLGVEKSTLIGTVKKVAVGKNGPYILLDAKLTRSSLDGSNGPAWTAIKPTGIHAAQVVSVVAPKPEPVAAAG